MEPIKININLKIDFNDDGTATITDKDTGLTITHPVPVGMTPDRVLETYIRTMYAIGTVREVKES